MWLLYSDAPVSPSWYAIRIGYAHSSSCVLNESGRGLAVDEAVARHRAVGKLLALEQEQRRVARGRQVAVGEQSGPRLVEVAREHLAVGAEVRVLRIAGRDRLAPWRREARDDRAGEGLVLGRLDHVRAQVVLVGERVDGLPVEPLELLRRLVQRVVVVLPALLVLLERLVELRAERALGRAHGLALRRAEAERERRGAVAPDEDARVLDDVAVRASVGRALEVDCESSSRADEPARAVRERPVERRVDGLGVVAVRRVGRRIVSYETSTGCPVEVSTVAESAPPFP